MQIMLIEPFGRSPGHPAVYLSKLTRAFPTGHRITIVSYDGFIEDWIPSDINHVVVTQKSKLVKLINRILPFPNTPLCQEIYYFVVTSLTIMSLKVLVKNKSDYVLNFTDGQILSLLLIGNILSKSLFINLHSFIPFLAGSKRNREFKGKEYKGYKLIVAIANVFVSLFLRRRIRNNSFICHSQEIVDAYKSVGRFANVRYIPWGIEDLHTCTVKTFREENEIPDKIFLVFGVNNPSKCYETIFRAFSKLNFKKFKLLFVGKLSFKNANNPYLLSARYGLQDNTIIIDDYVPEEDIPKYFLSADAVVVAYSKVFIGASGVLSHALEYRIPAIVSDVGQIGKFVKAGGLGLTFIPEYPEDLHKRIEEFLSLSDREIEAFRENISGFVSQFSWERIAQAQLEYYRGEEPNTTTLF
ncbi:glycosyltransferase [Candidatus Poribacteria bacterium]